MADSLEQLLRWGVTTTAQLALSFWPVSSPKNRSRWRLVLGAKIFFVAVIALMSFPMGLDEVSTALAARRVTPTDYELHVAQALDVGSTTSLGHHTAARIK